MNDFYETPDGKIYKLSDLKKVVSFVSTDNFSFESQQLFNEWTDLVEEFGNSLLSRFVTDEDGLPSLKNFYEFFNQMSGNAVIYGVINVRFSVEYLARSDDNKSYTFLKKEIRYDHKTLFFYGSIKDALRAVANQMLYIKEISKDHCAVMLKKFQIKEIRVPYLNVDDNQAILDSWFDVENK